MQWIIIITNWAINEQWACLDKRQGRLALYWNIVSSGWAILSNEHNSPHHTTPPQTRQFGEYCLPLNLTIYHATHSHSQGESLISWIQQIIELTERLLLQKSAGGARQPVWSEVSRWDRGWGKVGWGVIIKYWRVATWCCEGIAGHSDSLDIILFNDGSPIDIMLLQATQQPCPHIGRIVSIKPFLILFTRGIPICGVRCPGIWSVCGGGDILERSGNEGSRHEVHLIISYFDRQSGETTRSLIQSSQGELLK